MSEPPALPPIGPAADSSTGPRWPIAVAFLVLMLVVGVAAGFGAYTVISGLRSAGASPSPSPTATPNGTPATTTPPSATPPATATPRPSPPSPAEIEAEIARIEPAVAALRGLEQRRPVSTRLITTAALRERIAQEFADEYPAQELADLGRLYEGLGLLPPGSDLGALYQDLLGEQVIGLYDTDEKELFVVTDGPFGPLERVTTAHEYTHALQDQHFDLDAFLPEEHDQGDRTIARLAVGEGDATLLMFEWAQQALSADELLQYLRSSQDPAALERFAKMPAILREPLLFPYSQGFALVQDRQDAGGWAAVDALYADPPASTEQLLHLEKYAAHEAPVEVRLPDGVAAALGEGWSLGVEDSFGELVTRIWLDEQLGASVSREAAAGWGGDRVALYRGPDDAWAIAWETHWDSGAEADEFRAAAAQVVGALGSAEVATRRDGAVSVLVAVDAATLAAIQAALRE